MSERRRCGRTRLVAGAGLSLGATLGMAGTAEAADYTVGNLEDSGPGSLRAALLLSEDGNGATTTDRILFESSVSGTITLQSALPQINEGLEIVGPGADRLTISGGGAVRILDTEIGPAPPGNQEVVISGLTLAGGRTSRGAAIHNEYTVLTLRNMALTGNSTTSRGGAIYSAQGSLTIERSTISGNHSDSRGGGISSEYGFRMTIEDSTISGNTADNAAGGLYVYKGLNRVVSGSTIAGNTAGNAPGGIQVEDADLRVTSTLVADNSPQDLRSTGTGSFGLAFSLVEDSTGAALNQGGPNLLGLDAQLAPLAFNGGPTRTRALSPTSPAIDHGSDAGTDQRGLPRAVDFLGAPNATGTGANASDIGAFEFQPPRCAGKAATIVGTTRRIRGTPKADVIVGTPAKNVIRGRGGNDRICGGAGADRLLGGPGRDRLLGQKGKDVLRGGPGRDRLRGGPGRDRQRQ